MVIDERLGIQLERVSENDIKCLEVRRPPTFWYISTPKVEIYKDLWGVSYPLLS